MLIIASNVGCDVLVHHFETVEGFTPQLLCQPFARFFSFQRALFSSD